MVSFVGFLAIFSLFCVGVGGSYNLFTSLPVYAADANCPNVDPKTIPSNFRASMKKVYTHVAANPNAVTGNDEKKINILANPDKFGLTKEEACGVAYNMRGSLPYESVKAAVTLMSGPDGKLRQDLLDNAANNDAPKIDLGKGSLAVSSDNRLYLSVKGIDGGTSGFDDDIDCRIYVRPNTAQSTKNFNDVSGRNCVAATGSAQVATKKCTAINANAYGEVGGADGIQTSCNNKTQALKGETTGFPYWSFTGGQTIVLVDNNGNNAVLANSDFTESICPGFSGGIGLCDNFTKAEFLANYTKFCAEAKNKAKCAKVVTPVTDFNSPEYTASGAETANPSTSTLSDSSALINDPAGTVAAAAAEKAEDIFSALFNVVAAILLWFVYLLGWVAQVALYWLGIIILFFLRTNPAGRDFFEVAVAPWTLLISITNLMILGSFVYVGFGYILNLKNLKSNVQEFLQSVVIIAIALNFTIVGTATVINITQGVGEIFIYSYAATKGGTKNEDINKAVMGGVINSIGRVSVLRCGKQMTATPAAPAAKPTTTPATTTPAKPAETPKVASTECDVNKDPAGQLSTLASTSFSPITSLFSGKAGQATSALISESIFLIMMCVAIFVFWKAAYMAVMRIVGLWLLMITSPIALATYLSPIDSLKPIGKKWVDKMIKWSSFYPIFIFSLVLVNLLTERFAQINAGAQLSVVNDGAASGADQFALSLQVILGAVISIGALYATTNFLDKDFENFAKSAAGAIGKYAKPFTAAYSTTARVAGSALDKTIGGGMFTKSGKGVFSRIGAGVGGAVEGSFGGADKNLQSKNMLRKAFGRTQKIVGGAAKKGIFEGLGDVVEFTPYLAQGVAKAPGKLLEGFDRLRQGRAAAFNEDALGGLEKRIRSLTNSKDVLDFLDGDENLSRWAGTGKNMIEHTEQSAFKDGKPSPFAVDLKDRVQDAARKAMKTAGKKLSPIIAKAVSETIAAEFPEDIKLWDSGKNQVFEQLMNQASEDESLARQLFADPRTIKMAQQKYRDLDPNIQAKLAEKEPQVQFDPKDRQKAGAEFVSNTEKFKNASARAFADEDVVQGYKDAGGDMQKLFEKTGKGYDYQSQEAAKASVDLAFGGKSKSDAVNKAVVTANREVGNSFVAEDDLVRKQVALRQNKLTWGDLAGNQAPEILTARQRIRDSLQNSNPLFNTLPQADQEAQINSQKLDFDELLEGEQDKALNHFEAERTIKEFGHDVNNPNLLNQIKGKAYDDMNTQERIDEIKKYENTHVGQEAKANLGVQYTNASEKEQIEILRRVVATKAQSYKNSQSSNQNRVKEASMRYANSEGKGAKRAKIHGIAEIAIENAGKSKNWEDPKMFQAVGAAKIQNKFEGAANLGNQKISDILGSDIGFDSQEFNNIFINNSNEKQRQRDMRTLSDAFGDYHSSDPNGKARAKKTFKEKFGIDLDATTKSVTDPTTGQVTQVALTMGDPTWKQGRIPDPNDPTKTIPDPNDIQPRIPASNAQILEQKLLSTGQEYMNQEYIIREKGVNDQLGAIDYTRTQSRFGSAKSEFETLKNNKMTEEISSSGGENFASKASKIFGKFIFK
jgi:hypothetical protein